MTIVDRSMTVLDALLSEIGFADAPIDRLEIIDDGIALPTPWPVTANALAALAAVGLAASRLSELRGREAFPVTVRSVHAGLSMASSSYLLVNGKAAKFRDPFTGFYEAANGRHVFLHGNFPHLRDGVLSLLGANSTEEVAETAKTVDAFALEAQGIAAGLCIAAVRTEAEWQAEPQADAIKSLPLIEWETLPPAVSRNGSQTRMLDLSRVIAGPMAGRTMAEFGADVVVVSGPSLPSIESLVIDTGFGKRATELDLSAPSGRTGFEALISETDVVLDAYRPGSLPGRGYDKHALARLRPGLVHVDLDAFSRSGSWAGRRGYDSLVQASVGMCWDGQSPPANLPCQPLDYLTGYLGALAAMLGLIRRIETGNGQGARLSLVRTAQWMWDTYAALGPEPDAPAQRLSIDEVRSAGYLAPYETDFGYVEALRSPLQSRDWRWPSVPVPLGNDPARWL